MPLDPMLKMMLQSNPGPPVCSLPVAEARVHVEKMFAPMMTQTEPVRRTEDRAIPGPHGDIKVRIYVPEAASEPLPVVVFFHAGGWVMGGIDSHDNQSRSLANCSRCIVVSVDYRLAPENRFPVPFDDCFAAVQWVAESAASFGGDPGRIAVAGDSAGGNLAAAVTLKAAELGGPKIAHQLLIYPILDSRCDTASYRECAEGYMLTAADMHWYWSLYLGSKEDAESSLVSPVRAKHLKGLPSATVITAEYDPLRDEGETYASLLQEAGVQVRLKRYDGMTHGFMLMAAVLPQGREALQFAGEALRGALA